MRFKCDIYFFTREEGGRQTEQNSGILSQFIFYENFSTICEVSKVNTKSFALGKAYSDVEIFLPVWEDYQKEYGEKISLQNDKIYFLGEGSRKVAKIWNIHETH